MVNSLYHKEPARTPKQGATAKCSWGEGGNAIAEKGRKGITLRRSGLALLGL